MTLIEGAHVRVGLASDIELYDEFPQDYLSYTRRQHRWIRGDWQIADWILPRVPLRRRTSGAKPALLVRPLEGLRQPAPEPDTPRQPGIAHSLLVDFSSDRVARKPVVAIPLFFRALVQPITAAVRTRPQGVILLKDSAMTCCGHSRCRTFSAPGRARSRCDSAGLVSPPRLSSSIA